LSRSSFLASTGCCDGWYSRAVFSLPGFVATASYDARTTNLGADVCNRSERGVTDGVIRQNIYLTAGMVNPHIPRMISYERRIDGQGSEGSQCMAGHTAGVADSHGKRWRRWLELSNTVLTGILDRNGSCILWLCARLRRAGAQGFAAAAAQQSWIIRLAQILRDKKLQAARQRAAFSISKRAFVNRTDLIVPCHRNRSLLS
jgi:hypothetical protein